ncbi:hydroxymethylbilane synthase, partial [Streptomyces sp. SID10244]|nr:hydroxymethylbilane synthase [Streptomyces sp. SID10244]
LRAAVAAEDGSDVIRASVVGPVDRAEQLGKDLAAELLELGAGVLVGRGSQA